MIQRDEAGTPDVFQTVSELSRALDRHQSRREAGGPAVSVIPGSLSLTIAEIQLWARCRGVPLVEVASPRLDAIANAWADGLAALGGLRQTVVARLARQTGSDADELAGRIDRMSPTERALFLDETFPEPDVEGIEAASRWILERAECGPDLAVRLGSALPDRLGLEPASRAVVALGALIAPESGPFVVATRNPDEADPARSVEERARSLATLALAQPRWSSILTLEAGVLEDYLRSVPESREKALIRSGVIGVSGLDGPLIRPGLEFTAIPEATLRRLEADGASTTLVDRLLELARATSASLDRPEAIDRARSAAERFLFERLESLEATVGLFALNEPLDIPFGSAGRRMEVDLASATLMLALEIDGYHHFQDEDAYRRDRRKDYLLQRRGYLVIRILAGDVVARLEDVLDLILEAVASRRADRSDLNRDITP